MYGGKMKEGYTVAVQILEEGGFHDLLRSPDGRQQRARLQAEAEAACLKIFLQPYGFGVLSYKLKLAMSMVVEDAVYFA